MDDKHLGLLVENHTLVIYMRTSGIRESIMHWLFYKTDIKTTDATTDILSASRTTAENDPPGSTTTLGLFAWAVASSSLLHFLTTQRAFIMR